MAVLFALVPSLVAIIIFVGTFRLQAPRTENLPRPVTTQVRAKARATRTPLPLGAVRRTPIQPELRA
jgi:hypothetical protein